MSASLQYTLVGGEDGSSFISVFVPGQTPLVAHSSHPNFEQIVAGALLGDPSVADLFDTAQTAATKFDKLTERISVANGRLYFDGEEVNNSLAVQVVRFLNEGVEDWKPLVRFFDNVQQNPNEHSREQMYDWLSKRDFAITDNGMIVGYKGVARDGNGSFVSIHQGRAIVNGEVHTGNIPNPIGAVVEMPRGEVHHDPSQGCSSGLHVGTYEYAASFGNGALLEVHVNPRDVVSVPTDSDWAKMRTCRYTVVQTLDAPYQSAVVTAPYDWEDDEDFWGELDDEDECFDCGDHVEDCDC